MAKPLVVSAKSKVRQKAWNFMKDVPEAGLTSAGNPVDFDNHVGAAPERPLTPEEKEAFDALTADQQKQFKKYKWPHYANRQAQSASTGFGMTFCNEFGGQVGVHSIGTYTGAIDLRAWVTTGPRPWAWVEPSAGKEPKVGDTLYYLVPHQHIAVVVSVVGNRLNTLEAGQGGKDAKMDIMLWKEGAWPSPNLIGWLDIDLWEYGPGYSDSQPEVEGLWTVWGDKRRFRWTYKFVDDHVTWKDVFSGDSGPGTWRFEKDELVINWKSGTTDRWKLPLKWEGTDGDEFFSDKTSIDLYATKNP